MSLIGGVAGLLSWAVTALLAALLPAERFTSLSDLIAVVLLGGFIGGLTVAFSDRWSGNRVLPRWVVSGVGIGIAAGLCSWLLQIPVADKLGPQAPFLARLIAWMLAGSLIGLGLGLRWAAVNRARIIHACAGGLAGGTIGGLIFLTLGSRVPDLSQALGFMFIGVGICFGVTLAPILLRDGVLEFISSGDPRAQGKFGLTHKQWELQQGDSYLIGSQSVDMSRTVYRPEVHVFIPDATVAPRHAILFGKQGRFFLARHPEISNQSGLARFVTRVRGRTVTVTQELHDRDDILLGRTALRFTMRRKERSEA
jgi:hypothetical protein